STASLRSRTPSEFESPLVSAGKPGQEASSPRRPNTAAENASRQKTLRFMEFPPNNSLHGGSTRRGHRVRPQFREGGTATRVPKRGGKVHQAARVSKELAGRSR